MDDPPPNNRVERLEVATIVMGFTVNDLTASLAWYRDVLACEVAKVWSREGRMTAATMRAGNVEFLLQQDDFAKGRDRKKGEGCGSTCRRARTSTSWPRPSNVGVEP